MNAHACFALRGHIIDSSGRAALRIRADSYLVCEDGFCAGVYASLPERYRGIAVEDHRDKLIIPGLIDLHTHAPQYAFRGMGMDDELSEWLQKQTYPEEARYADPDYARRAYAIFVEELRKSATARACIFATRHRDATILLMDMLEQSGLISYVGKVNMDRSAPLTLCETNAARDTLDWLNAIRNRYARTMPILTPRFIPACSEKLLEALRDIRRAHRLPVQSHLSENLNEVAWVRALRPDAEFYADAYDKHGLLGAQGGASTGEGCVMAHCVWSSDAEIARLAERDVFVAHCPASNMNISSGIAPIRKYLERNIRVGLGSDIAGGHALSIFRAMTDAIQLSKLYWRHIDMTQKPLTLEEAFYMATWGGGAFFGNVGAFETGFELDALVLDDSCLKHPYSELTLRQRLERAIYLDLDSGGIVQKLVRGRRIFGQE